VSYGQYPVGARCRAPQMCPKAQLGLRPVADVDLPSSVGPDVIVHVTLIVSDRLQCLDGRGCRWSDWCAGWHGSDRRPCHWLQCGLPPPAKSDESTEGESSSYASKHIRKHLVGERPPGARERRDQRRRVRAVRPGLKTYRKSSLGGLRGVELAHLPARWCRLPAI